MNDKDKKAFYKFWKQYEAEANIQLIGFDTWQAACEYKQKEIDILDRKYTEDVTYLDSSIQKLQAHRKNLREAIEYALEWSGDINAWNRLNEALKEVGEE